MTVTPIYDLADQLRRAAVKGTRCHLDVDLARAAAQHPRIMALLAELAAEETAKLCLAAPITNSPPLPLFPDRGSLLAMPDALPPRAGAESAQPGRKCGSSGEPNAPNMQSPGMIEPLVPAAASKLASDQARETIRLAVRSKHSRHILPPAPDRPSRSSRPTLVCQQS